MNANFTRYDYAVPPRTVAFVSRHTPSPQEQADLAGYRLVQVNPPGRIEPRHSWLDCCLACNGIPDLVVLVLPKPWLTPFVKHAKKLSPQTRIVRPHLTQYDGERWEWSGQWVEFLLYKDGTRRVAWTPEKGGQG